MDLKEVMAALVASAAAAAVQISTTPPAVGSKQGLNNKGFNSYRLCRRKHNFQWKSQINITDRIQVNYKNLTKRGAKI